MQKVRALIIAMIVWLVIVLLTVSLAFAQNGDVSAGEDKPAVVHQRHNEERTLPRTADRYGRGGTTYCYTQTVTIPDNWPYGFTATMFISDSLIIDDLNLILTVTHSSVGDLSFELFYVNFNTNVYTSRLVYNRPGFPTTPSGCEGDDVAATINDEGLDDDLEYTCLAGTPAIAGDLVGDDPPNTKSMADFNGADLAGVYWWVLATDHAAGDAGTLDGWCVEVNSNESAEIEVNPAGMNSVQLPDVVVTQPLTISNLGNINLNWMINEVSSAAAINSDTGGGGCSPNDIPWLNVNPMNGTTSPGGSNQVDVSFDSTGMAVGLYTGSICIESNDLDSPALNVPVTLTVENSTVPMPTILLTKTVGLDNSTCASTANLVVATPGTEVYYCYTVENTGNVTFTLHDLFDDQLGQLLTADPQLLVPGQTISYFPVTATITGTVTNVATWTASDPAAGQTAMATATAAVMEAPTAVSLSDFFGQSGNALRPALLALLLACLITAVLFIHRRHTPGRNDISQMS